MNFFRQFVHRPQPLWVRQFNFQVHLWMGIVLSLYFILIGVTGSLLVFRQELETLAGVKPWHGIHAKRPFADIVTVIDNVQAAYPGARVLSALTPTEADPFFVATMQSADHSLTQLKVAVHPVTGEVLGRMPRADSWVAVVQRLHVNLLMGRTGRKLNGVAAGFLMLLNVTGLVVWWPGIKSWTRALKVDFGRKWRRINFDLHRAAGFWTLAVVSAWAVSGVYFAWPSETIELVKRFSPVIAARPPAVRVQPKNVESAPVLHDMIAQAHAADPGTTLRGLAFPATARSPLLIFMRRGNGIGYEYADTLYFDPYDGKHLTTWRYGINQSLGDWFIWLQVPLHFGTYWGMGIKILWAALGLTVPLLTITGAVMYWNRALRRKWKHWRERSRKSSEPGDGNILVRG